ncbi:MAG: glucosaminidase domain-containing protein [Mariprofundaceae bacterium]|nr:glucosaminidase domain-containing protein [Mariprofundaceae bacterium]
MKNNKRFFSTRFAMACLMMVGLLLAGCSQELETAQAESEYPAVRQVADIPDFAAVKDTKARKKAFFDFMRPIVRAENARLAKARLRMLSLFDMLEHGDSVRAEQKAWLLHLAKTYHVKMPDLHDEHARQLLKQRVDTVPLRLVLAQSANESSWGTSRFAREGRNFFGQWCFTAGCGIVPGKRSAGLTHEVAVFATVNASVASYLRHINYVEVYTPLRLIRHDMRMHGKKPTAHNLAGGLKAYSQRGLDYVDEIRSMIRTNFELMAG